MRVSKIISKIFLISFFLFSLLHGKSCKVDRYTYIPHRAKIYSKYVVDAVNKLMPNFDKPWYFLALIEHETCITLCKNRCWSPTSFFKKFWDKEKIIPRELGAGLPMITKTWYRDGRPKWDMLLRMKKLYRKYLRTVWWDNILTTNPQIVEEQASIIILLWKHNYKRFLKEGVGKDEAIWFSDVAYNVGIKNVLTDMTICKFTPNCDPKKWWNNVENVKRLKEKKLYGRTSWDISRQHARRVYKTMFKYRKFYYNYLIKNRKYIFTNTDKLLLKDNKDKKYIKYRLYRLRIKK